MTRVVVEGMSRTMTVDRLTRREVFGEGFAVGAAVYRLHEAVLAHVHDFIELAVVTDGAARHDTAVGSVVLERGDWVVIRPGDWHAYAPEPGVGGFAVTNAYLGPELVHDRLGWALDHPGLARLLLRGGRGDRLTAEQPLLRIAGWLSQLAAERPDADEVIKLGLLSCALVELDRSTGATTDEQLEIGSSTRSAMQAMTADLAHPWTVNELAARVGVSVSTLYRQFAAQLGNGPVEWLTRVRAEQAAALLIQTDLPVAAIGRRVGWPDPSYASRRFGQAYATTPTAYRAAHAAVVPGPFRPDVP
jgi:AraC-like DNA-binding protein/quercetin dioxygenase-like cupin family protein